MKNTNEIDHATYPKQIRTASVENLRFIIRDCQEAIAANPDNPKNSKYADEIAYCGMELRKREK